MEQSTEANIAAGMSPDEARRQALVEFGGVERTREQCHEQRPGWWMGTVGQDVRYALRGFRRNCVFTIAVIATLARGDWRDDGGLQRGGPDSVSAAAVCAG